MHFSFYDAPHFFIFGNSQLQQATSRAEVLYSEAELGAEAFHFFSIISIGSPPSPAKINFQSRQSELIILRPILWVRGGWRGCSYLLFENLLCNLHQVVPKEAFVTQRKGKTSQHYQMDGKHWDETSIYYWSF